MLLPLLAASALAQDPCSKIGAGAVAGDEPAQVLVLGERKGVGTDQARARRLLKRMAKRGPVTLALQIVPLTDQEALDRVAAGTLAPGGFAAETGFAERAGFGIDAWAELLTTASELGATLLAIGQPVEPRPEGALLPMPPGYIHVLADAMSDAPVPLELESRYVERVAWLDHRLAASALERWTGEGTLILLVDRLHVEGNLGAQWQAERLSEVPVRSALLANAGAACYPGDRVLR